MSYRNSDNSLLMRSGGTWSLIALAISSCSLALVSSKWYREESMQDWRPGRRPPLSSEEHLLELRTTCRGGSVIGSKIGLPGECESWKPKRESIPLSSGSFLGKVQALKAERLADRPSILRIVAATST